MDALERIEARAAIVDLIHAYTLAVRTGRPEDAGALFTRDGVFQVRQADPMVPGSLRELSSSEGPEAIGAYIRRSMTTIRMLPMIHNILVTFDGSGDTATSTCLMEGRAWPTETVNMGDYADSFAREDGAWRFTRRAFTMYKVAAPDAG